MGLYLLKPIGDIVERELLGTIKDKYDTHCTLVVGLGDCTESFLSRGVPHLKLHSLVIDWYGFNFEINAYSLYYDKGE